MSDNERKRVPGARRQKAKTPSRKNAPEVVYTPAKAFNRKKLLLHVLTIVAVAFAVFLGLSIFFKVDTILVSGSGQYSEWTVAEASGIEKGDSLLFFGEASAASKIIDKLPYVTAVRFDIKLPGTVTIIVEEAPTAYAIQDTGGRWWLITAAGRVVEQVDSARAGEYASIKGLTLQSPTLGQDAVAASTEPEGSVITGADRLKAALEIIAAVEKNEMFDKIVSVDVSKLQALELRYEDRFQVKLGNLSDMDYKIAALRSAISTMSQYETGILDASDAATTHQVKHYDFPE